MKKTFIIYLPGSYGSFIQWVLDNANVPMDQIQLPFTPSGSAHLVTILDPDYEAFFLSNQTLGRCHVTLQNMRRLSELVLENYKNVNIVGIGIDFSSEIWCINNVNDKTIPKITDRQQFLSLLSRWGTPPYETWQIRECLSMYFNELKRYEDDLRNGVYNMVSMNDHTIDQYPQIGFYFTMAQLRDDFENTIKNLCNFCSRPYLDSTIDYIKRQWFLTQKHVHKDSLLENIVYNIVNNIDFTITDKLTIVDEAVIQNKLFDQGIELKCYGLNEFPKTNKEFQNLVFYKFDTLITNNLITIAKKVYNHQISHDEAILQISTVLKKLNG